MNGCLHRQLDLEIAVPSQATSAKLDVQKTYKLSPQMNGLVGIGIKIVDDDVLFQTTILKIHLLFYLGL